MWRLVISILIFAGIAFADEKRNQKIDWIIHTREAKVQKLRKEINIYNLLNGLHLSKKQLFEIIRHVERVKKLKERRLGKDKPRGLPSLKRELMILKKMKRRADAGKFIPKWMERTYGQEVGEKSKKPQARRENRRKYTAELKAIEDKVEQVLSPAQRQVIADYKPCLIPPKNLKDPVRVGQASNNSQLVRILERAREIEINPYLKEQAFNKLVVRLEKHQGRFTSEERREIRNRWQNVIDEAKSLSDAEFELLKEDLAKKLELPDKKQYLQKMLAGEAKRQNKPGKIAGFLLNPEMLPLLKRRLALMNQTAKSEAADLSKIEKAQSCKDGKCAVED